MRDARQDAATARTIDIALILQRLRGKEEAEHYLRSAHAAEELIERVLSPGCVRTSLTTMPKPPKPPASFKPAGNGGPPGGGEPSGRRERPGDGEPPESGEAPPDSPKGPHFYRIADRRRDVVRAAVVQAAIAMAREFDVARAERMLRRELLPDEVIARVLGQDDSRRRVRR